ncbi:MAG: hypothetical protein Q9168_007728 [Polycauliona sp. 1 TL-2023]
MWLDAVNLHITRPVMNRAEPPFQDFIYRMVPANTEIAPMTPVVIGIMNLYMMSFILNKDISSGSIFSLITLKLGAAVWPIGQVEIYNQPLQPGGRQAPGTPNATRAGRTLEQTFWANTSLSHVSLQPNNLSVSQPSNESKPGLQITPKEMERRFFYCIREFFLFIFASAKADRVTSRLPSSSTGPKRYAFYRDGAHSGRDSLQVTVYDTPATQRLTFQELAEEVLVWGTRVSGDESYSTAAVVKRGDVQMVILRVVIEGEGPAGGVADTMNVDEA